MGVFSVNLLKAHLRSWLQVWQQGGDDLLLWGGLVFSALGFGALILYLVMN
jgi:hypothetical protein